MTNFQLLFNSKYFISCKPDNSDSYTMPSAFITFVNKTAISVFVFSSRFVSSISFIVLIYYFISLCYKEEKYNHISSKIMIHDYFTLMPLPFRISPLMSSILHKYKS